MLLTVYAPVQTVNNFEATATLDLVTMHPQFVTHSQKGSPIYIPH